MGYGLSTKEVFTLESLFFGLTFRAGFLCFKMVGLAGLFDLERMFS